MSTYVFVYRPPSGSTPGDPDATAAWTAWFGGISDHVVELGKPVFSRRQVGDVPAGGTELGGYSLISAADLDEAVSLTKGCPVLTSGGGIEIGELTDVAPEAIEAMRAVAGLAG